MKVLELFSGTSSVGNAFKRRGHDVFTIDWDDRFVADMHEDIGQITPRQIIEAFGRPDVIWASPDCTTYSVAAISRHRKRSDDGTLLPVTEYAKRCDETNRHLMALIGELRPKLWFIENQRAGMRKMDFVRGLPRYTVTYCKYGDIRMKPTDIWTNHPAPKFEPPCRNGDHCHESAPRGSRSGTQRLSNAIDKARIPTLLCEHIVDICEEVIPWAER